MSSNYPLKDFSQFSHKISNQKFILLNKIKNNTILKYGYLLTISFLLLSYVGLVRVISHFPGYDDAYNASVAKNLSSGLGYATSFNKIILFNHEITTGPTLIIPASIFIKFFGNQYWVPAITALVIVLILFSLLVYILNSYFVNSSVAPINQKRTFIKFSFSILLLSIFWIPDLSIIEFLGELPAALFMCAGTLFLFKPHSSNFDIIWGGLLFGLSITTKFISISLIIPIILFWAILLFYKNKNFNNPKKNLTKILVLAVSIFLPGLVFEIYKLLSIGFLHYTNLKRLELAFILSNGSGVNQIITETSILSFMQNNLFSNYQELKNLPFLTFRFIPFIIVNFIALYKNIIKIKTKSEIKPIDYLSFAFFISVLPLTFWWFLFSFQGWYRTLSPALTITSLSILVSSVSINFRRANIILIIILIFWFSVSPNYWLKSISAPEIPTGLIASTESTINFLAKYQTDGYKLYGCGWWANRRLEYLMPKSKNFYQCLTRNYKNSLLVIDSTYWNWEASEAIKKVEDHCSDLIYESEPYQVFLCKKQ